MTEKQLIFLELNEVNFEFIEYYVSQRKLNNFKHLIEKHGYAETSSENDYDHLEPWIQWVTAHTGLSFAEHQVYRLGDIINHDIPQIWERLEKLGFKVGAVSPMNAKFRLKDPAFFVPDPWTQTEVHADEADQRFFAAISKAVNENASGRMDFKSFKDFALGALRNAAIASYPTYLRLLRSARSKAWYRALFLDQLLTDMFIRLMDRDKPQFASLFLNAAAHIQHHYMFNSRALADAPVNPSWYLAPSDDPVFDVYELYDQIIGRVIRKFPEARVMLATGLHQVPHHTTTFYWRLKDHESFMRQIGVDFSSIEPRMSRDFLVTCRDAASAAVAQAQLENAHADDGSRLFSVDNRGCDLFVMLIYAKDIDPELGMVSGNHRVSRLRDYVNFVAIKNGEHDGTGYFLDNGLSRAAHPSAFPLTEMPDRIVGALVAT